MTRRVVMTGTGLVTCLGIEPDEHWRRVVRGETGIQQVDTEGYPELRYLAVVSDASLALPPRDRKALKLLVRSSLMGFIAAERAIADAGIALEHVPTDRKGIYLGSGERDTSLVEAFHPVLARSRTAAGTVDYQLMGSDGLRFINPNYLLSSLPNGSLCQITIRHGIRGTSSTLVEDSPAGIQALGRAFRAIRAGRAEVMLCGSTESLADAPSRNTLRALGVLSGCAEGAASFRPFDTNRDGYIPGEGAAFLVFEELEHARERGAHIYAEVIGAASAMDVATRGRPSPEGEGVAYAIHGALRDASLAPEAIGHVTAHGGATRDGDLSELNGLRAVFNGHIKRLSVTATKPIVGCMGPAGDVADVYFTARALHEGLIPPTAHTQCLDTAADEVPVVVGAARAQPCTYAMSLSRNNLGCQVGALVLKRWDDA